MICRAIPYDGDEPYIFLSYCHKDSSKLYPLFEEMALDGYRVWYDNGNHAGDDWLENIENFLEECKVVVAFVSENSSLSHNCRSEITYAISCKKKVIPVLIDSANLPKGMRMQLSYLHNLKSADYPSNKALLAKIYEAEECKACKGTAGSGNLRYEPQEECVTSATEQKTTSFWDGLKLKKSENEGEEPSKITETEPSKVAETAPPEVITEDVITAESSGEKGTGKQHVKIKTKKVKVFAMTRKRKAEPDTQDAEQAPQEVKTAPVVPKEPDISTKPEEPGLIPERRNPTDVQVSGPSQDLDETDVDPRFMDDPDDEGTVIIGRKYQQSDEDGDVTVRIVNNYQALLLHPAGQRAYILRKPQVKIGRSPFRCDVVIEGNESVSKHHADIIQYGGKCFLRDANSANGTFLNGQQLEAEKQVQLDYTALFRLYNETMILISGHLADSLIRQKAVSLLINSESTAMRLVDEELPLNRSHQWPDGTLSDPKIHREKHGMGHARLKRQQDGMYLVDECPEYGNGTLLNGRMLKNGESCLLSSGDQIRLGDTTLQFVSITI